MFLLFFFCFVFVFLITCYDLKKTDFPFFLFFLIKNKFFLKLFSFFFLSLFYRFTLYEQYLFIHLFLYYILLLLLLIFIITDYFRNSFFHCNVVARVCAVLFLCCVSKCDAKLLGRHILPHRRERTGTLVVVLKFVVTS